MVKTNTINNTAHVSFNIEVYSQHLKRVAEDLYILQEIFAPPARAMTLYMLKKVQPSKNDFCYKLIIFVYSQQILGRWVGPTVNKNVV